MAIEESPWSWSNPERCRLLTPVCVKYGHPDLDKTHSYLEDFGLVKVMESTEDGLPCIFYRGYGVQPVAYIAIQTTEPVFLGVYFEAASKADFDKATRTPGAGEVNKFLDGQVVAITDPSGIPFHVVYGYSKRDFTPRLKQIHPFNYPTPNDQDPLAKPRKGTFHRLDKNGPIPVHKLGHCGYFVQNLNESCNFYCTHFNFKPSDFMMGQENSVKLIFFHLDLGQHFSDHHSLFLIPAEGPFRSGSPHHAAFEVESIDAQFIGHSFLESKGYKPWWGVGRHIEGSQVYDYWFDLDGFIVEHYADGDLVNEDNKINYVAPRDGHDRNNWGPLPLPLA